MSFRRCLSRFSVLWYPHLIGCSISEMFLCVVIIFWTPGFVVLIVSNTEFWEPPTFLLVLTFWELPTFLWFYQTRGWEPPTFILILSNTEFWETPIFCPNCVKHRVLKDTDFLILIAFTVYGNTLFIHQPWPFIICLNQTWVYVLRGQWKPQAISDLPECQRPSSNTTAYLPHNRTGLTKYSLWS